jgi:enamine deaminase RidA (YjgF/YER057c/UK114 family)
MTDGSARDGGPGLVDARLLALGLRLPSPLTLPSPNRCAAVLHGRTLYLSGHGAALLEDVSVPRRGRIPDEVTEAEAYRTARALALKMIATVKAHVGDLDRVERIVKLVGYVNAHPDFERHNKVLDGASDLLLQVFGPEAGRHARSSLGVVGLVGRQPLEIEAILALRE